VLNRAADDLRDALMGEQHRKDLENRHEEVRDLEKVEYLAWSLQRGAQTPPGGVYVRQSYGNVAERFGLRTG
jgi:hypothetical protein